jgi:hypothetical protein
MKLQPGLYPRLCQKIGFGPIPTGSWLESGLTGVWHDVFQHRPPPAPYRQTGIGAMFTGYS